MRWFELLHTSITLEVLMALRKESHTMYPMYQLPIVEHQEHRKEKLWPTSDKRWLAFIISLWEVILARHPLGEPVPTVKCFFMYTCQLLCGLFAFLNSALGNFHSTWHGSWAKSLVLDPLSTLSPLLTTVSNSWHWFRGESRTCNHRKT